MIPNPRIHRPNARSYVPTITQSTALWKAMRHREEMERRRQVLRADFAGIRLVSWIKQAVGSLPFLRQRS
ncbi:MAG: hypothetical protein ACR2RV_26115 [Verrucomicrobiales bacterium]